MSRVFEKILTNSITSFLLTNSLLSPSQFGFTSGKSVELQLLSCLKTWTSAINDNKFIDNIYFDFKKALIKYHTENFSLKSKILVYLVIFIYGLRVF